MRSQVPVAAGQCKVLFMYRIFGLLLRLGLAAQPIVFCANVEAEDWPRFLGPRGDNTSRETGLLEKWSTNGPPMVWEKEIGSGYGAPSVLGDELVLHHRIANQEIVQAFNAATGEPIWRYAYASRFEDPFGYNNGPRSTPLLTSNRCYTFGAEGRLVSLELKT